MATKKVKHPKPPMKIYRGDTNGHFEELKNTHGQPLRACGECGTIWTGDTQAQDCCQLQKCTCGDWRDQEYPHQPCCQCRENARKGRKRYLTIDQYKKIAQEVMVVIDDDFYSDLYEVVDEFCDEQNKPTEVCIAYPRRFSLNPDQIIEDALENHHEDAINQVVDWYQFAQFINQWTNKQTLKTYETSRNYIILDWEELLGA